MTKQKLTLSVDSELVKRAKQAGIPLSELAERAIEAELKATVCPTCNGTGKIYKLDILERLVRDI